MMNRVVLVGRLTNDPEQKPTQSNTSMCVFTVAVDNRQKNADGTWGASFIPCVCYQLTADNVIKKARRGSIVGVEGRLNQRKFQRKDGTNGSAIEVVCDSVTILDFLTQGGKKSSSENDEDTPKFDDQPAESTNSNLDKMDLPDDDLPF